MNKIQNIQSAAKLNSWKGIFLKYEKVSVRMWKSHQTVAMINLSTNQCQL